MITLKMCSSYLPERAADNLVPWLLHLGGSTSNLNSTDRFKRNRLFEPRLITLINQYLEPKPFVIPNFALCYACGEQRIFLCDKHFVYLYDTSGICLNRICHTRPGGITVGMCIRNNQLFLLSDQGAFSDQENVDDVEDVDNIEGVEDSGTLTFSRFDLTTRERTNLFEVEVQYISNFEVHPGGQLIYCLTEDGVFI